MIKKYELSDINLVSRKVSEIKSRSECDTSSCHGTVLECEIPIMNAPMKCVADCHSVSEVNKNGGIGLLHRFGPLEDRISEYIACTYAQYKCSNVGVSIGINGDYKEEFKEFLEHGATLFCIDVANSSSYNVKESVLSLIKIYPFARFIVGNAMSREGVDFWNDVDQVVAVRVGVAGGSACTTKNATGMYHPMASLLAECKNSDKIIIADGGIKEPQDLCKAICLGADLVMMGGVFASCKDSPADIVGSGWKRFYGSASEENQKSYKSCPKYIEGREMLIPMSDLTIAQTMLKFQEGLQSSMSYANAKNLKDFRNFVEIVRS